MDQKKRDAQKNAYQRAHYDRLLLLATREEGERIREDARRAGKSLTRYLLDAVAYYREAMH